MLFSGLYRISTGNFGFLCTIFSSAENQHIYCHWEQITVPIHQASTQSISLRTIHSDHLFSLSSLYSFNTFISNNSKLPFNINNFKFLLSASCSPSISSSINSFLNLCHRINWNCMSSDESTIPIFHRILPTTLVDTAFPKKWAWSTWSLGSLFFWLTGSLDPL